MPTTALINIAVMILLMIALPFIWPENYVVRPWVMILLLVAAVVIAVVAGAKWRRRGWDTDATRRLT